MMNAGVVIVPGLGFLPLGLAEGNGLRLQLARETRLVTLLQHARLAQQRANRVRGLRADVEPVVDARRVEVERLVPRARLILADDLDELAVARALGVGDDDAIHGGLLTTDSTKANLDGHLCSPMVFRAALGSSRSRHFRDAPRGTANCTN